MYQPSLEHPDSEKSVIGLDIRALDPSFKEHAHRGIGRYVRELYGYFSRSQSDLVSVQGFNFESLNEEKNPWVRALDAAVEKCPVGRTTLRQQLLFPLKLGRVSSHGTRFSTLHFPAHMDAPAWGLKGYILTVLDLIPLVCADLYKAQNLGPRYHFARWLEKCAIQNASLVLAISENTAQDVHKVMGVPRERIVVTPLGVHQKFSHREERKFSPEERLALLTQLGISSPDSSRPLLLYVGGIDPRKNYPLLVKIISKLRRVSEESRSFTTPLLLMAGNISADKEYPRLLEEIRSSGVEDLVRLLGYVDDAMLTRLYRAADVFLFPSLYEGFGLPPLEAMSAGLPVVSSNTSAMPEVIGDAALLADPCSADEFVEAVRALLTTPSLMTELSERGIKRAKMFTWDKTGERTLEAYELLARETLTE